VVTLLRKNRSASAFLPHVIYQFVDPRPMLLACSDPDATEYCKGLIFMEQFDVTN
jgi:hypothetical protein